MSSRADRRPRAVSSARARGALAIAAALLSGCGPSAVEITEVRVPEASPIASAAPTSEPEATPERPPSARGNRRPAEMDPGPSSEHEDTVRFARERFYEGVAAYDSGDYQTACTKFQAAYDAVPNQALLFNLGSCELKMGHKEKACEIFRTYLKNGDPADPRIQEVTKQVAAKCP